MRMNETWTTFWYKVANKVDLEKDEFGRDLYWHIIDPTCPEIEAVVHCKDGVTRLVAQHNAETDEWIGAFGKQMTIDEMRGG